MFCNGICKKGNKRCGLSLDVFMKNDMTGSEKVIEKCAIIGIFESLVRQEQGQIRIQAAVESGRNENVRCLREQDKTLATGFLGLLKYAEDREEEAAKYYKMIEEEQKEKYIEAEIIEGEVEEDGSV
jgi:hypothetical protein